MDLAKAVRLAGFFGFLGGLLGMIAYVMNVSLDDRQLTSIVTLCAMVLVSFGLIGMYNVQLSKIGMGGLLFFILAHIGTLMMVAISWTDTFIFPVLEAHAPKLLEGPPPSPASIGFFLSLSLFTGGWTLFALWSLVKKGLPVIPLVLIIIAGVSDWVPMGYYASALLWSLGVTWLGYCVWKDKVPAS